MALLERTLLGLCWRCWVLAGKGGGGVARLAKCRTHCYLPPLSPPHPSLPFPSSSSFSPLLFYHVCDQAELKSAVSASGGESLFGDLPMIRSTTITDRRWTR